MIKVLYFGIAQEIAGFAEELFRAENTVSLNRQITEKYPRMKKIVFRLALNGRMITGETPLKENDIVAVLPPFAGG